LIPTFSAPNPVALALAPALALAAARRPSTRPALPRIIPRAAPQHGDLRGGAPGGAIDAEVDLPHLERNRLATLSRLTPRRRRGRAAVAPLFPVSRCRATSARNDLGDAAPGGAVNPEVDLLHLDSVVAAPCQRFVCSFSAG